MNQGRVQGPRLFGRKSECEALDRLLTDAISGTSQVIVLRGDAGVGKSALLEYLSHRAAAWHIASAVGVNRRWSFPTAASINFVGRCLITSIRLPDPQREALATVFGLSAGPAPDRFSSVLRRSRSSRRSPRSSRSGCIVDDAHWLDSASAQILGFIGRRLLAERIAVVCAVRTGIGEDVLVGLPEMPISGLGDSDSRALLLGNVPGPLDAAVCAQIITESHGNPLALLEFPRSWNVADLAGGFGVPDSQPIVSKIEQSYVRRLRLLPPRRNCWC